VILGHLLDGVSGKEDSVNLIHQMLTEKGREIDDHKVPLDRYVITKGLTKAPADYPDAKHQPHVQVALRMIARGVAVQSGADIPYVICDMAGEGGAKSSYADRARHPHEFQLDPSLRVDIAWYKSQQVHPPLARMLGPVEGTDPARLAECLGMDSARFAQASIAAAAAAAGLGGDSAFIDAIAGDMSALLDRTSRWKTFATTLVGVVCGKCAENVAWKQMLQPEEWEKKGVSALFRCGSCDAEVVPARAQNLLAMQLRALLRSQLDNVVQCTDEVCLRKTRRLSRGGRSCAQPFCTGTVQDVVSQKQVLHELEFIAHLCSTAEGVVAGEDSRGCRESAAGMQRLSRWLLNRNSYNWVDCGKMFGDIFGKATP